jgi:ABC-type sugar transport system, periplasmic component
MNGWLKRVLLLLILGLFIGLAGYSYNFNRIQIRLTGADGAQKTLKYHFAMILQDDSSNFWQQLEQGARSAAKTYGAAVEFNAAIVRNEDEELQNLSIAIASHMDGIAIYVTDDKKFTPLINKAVSQNIPVVTIESDDKASRRVTFVGPNSYDAGYAAGSMIKGATNGRADVAVLFSGNFTGDTNSQNAMIGGMKFAVDSCRGIRLETIRAADSGYFDAEKTIRDILTNDPEINTIFCTSSDDTLEVTKVIIELNEVGKITVVGYNNLPQIRDYIMNDVIYGSVGENPESTGYQSVKALVLSREGRHLPRMIDTGVARITRSNILEYTS